MGALTPCLQADVIIEKLEDYDEKIGCQCIVSICREKIRLETCKENRAAASATEA